MSHDDLDTPQPLSNQDIALARELATVREQRKCLYEKLDGSLKALFSHCEWRITCYDNGMTELVVVCPRKVVYKRLHDRALTIHRRLEDIVEVKHTKFILYCPKDTNVYYEHESIWGEWSEDFFLDDDNPEF